MKTQIQSPRPYIRQARPPDKEAVLRFCQDTWEWGDYIPQVWDRWLREPDGKLLVTTIGTHPVAVGHIVMVTPSEAWLEGIRVDPVYRRTGLATRLTRRFSAEARAMGADVIRFLTSSLNTPIHRIAAKIGFARVASILPYEAEATQIESPLSSPEQRDLPHLLSFRQRSTVLEAMGGLYGTGWRFHSLTPEQINIRLTKGQVRTVGEHGDISAMAIIEPGYSGEGLVATYVDGQPDSLYVLALGLRAEATRYDPPLVGVRLPATAEVQRVFRSAGYHAQSEQPFWIFQQTLVRHKL